MPPSSINKKRLEDIFLALDEAALEVSRTRQVLCVFGAAAILSYGSTERQTQVIDVWRPASQLNDRALRQMAEAAGLDVNPTELDPEREYLQIINDGVVQMPIYDLNSYTWANGQKSETLWSGDAITIVAPPAAIVAAAKMVRSEPQDIDDVAFLMNVKRVSVSDILKAISYFPEAARERATENMVILDFALPGQAKEVYAMRKKEGFER